MPSTRYSYDIDLSNLNSSQALGVLSVPPGSRVLDVGAADGSVARLLADRGCRVWGIEVDEPAARAAAAVCERVLVRDVEQPDFETDLQGMRFDAILFLDVLEHLRDPLTVLKRSRRWLEPHGQVIASIPNVTHGAVRLSVLRGVFTYTETGLLDRTHLRFFDRAAVDALFAAAGLQVRDRLRVTRGLTETEIPIDLESFPSNVVAEVMADPDAATFQFVVVASVPEVAGSTRPSDSLAGKLQRRMEGLEQDLHSLQTYVRDVETESHERAAAWSALESRHQDETARLAELTAELTRRMDELHQRDREVKFLAKSLAVKEAFIAELRSDVATLESGRQSDAAIIRGHREFVSSTGVRMLVKASRRLRRFPQARRVLHALLQSGSSVSVAPERPVEPGALDDQGQGLARVAQHWSTEAGAWKVGRGVHWLEHPLVLERINFKVSGRYGMDRYEYFVRTYLGPYTPVERALTLGCGAGELERGLAKYNLAREHEALDIAAGAIDNAARQAQAVGLSHIRYRVEDLNRITLVPDHYDVVFATSSLHHIASLEHLLAQVARSLKPGGFFFVDEYVGPNRFQWTDSQLAAVNEQLDKLPDPLRQSIGNPGTQKRAVQRPAVSSITDVDPSEAIRSEEIVGLVPKYFQVIEQHGHGGSLLNLLLEDIAGNFCESNPGSLEHLRQLFELEDQLIEQGSLEDDFATIIARKRR